MAHPQKPEFFFRRNGRVHLNRRGRQFSRLLAAEVCASAVVMLDTPCSEVVWRVLAIHTIRQFSLHFLASLCAIIFQLDSTHHRRARSSVLSQYLGRVTHFSNENRTVWYDMQQTPAFFFAFCISRTLFQDVLIENWHFQVEILVTGYIPTGSSAYFCFSTHLWRLVTLVTLRH